MSQNNSVPNAQAPIVLNPQTLAKVMQWLELAKARAHELAQVPLYEQQQNAVLDFELAQVEFPITQALAVLNNTVMQGETITPPKRQTTGYGLEVDGAGYDCHVLLNEEGDDYHEINPKCTPPAGHRQVCIKCGYDSFMRGVFYGDCPQCQLRVVHYCRYVAIAGGV